MIIPDHQKAYRLYSLVLPVYYTFVSAEDSGEGEGLGKYPK